MMGIAGAAIILAFPCFIMATNPHVETSQSFCPMKMLAGLPCPGCGITKSLVFAYQGEIQKSLSYHIFGFPAILACVVTIAVLIVEIITGKEYFQNILYSRRLTYVLAFILGGYHLVRTVIFVIQHSLTEILRESIWM
jgi:hypothetical protein